MRPAAGFDRIPLFLCSAALTDTVQFVTAEISIQAFYFESSGAGDFLQAAGGTGRRRFKRWRGAGFCSGEVVK